MRQVARYFQYLSFKNAINRKAFLQKVYFKSGVF